MTASAEGADGSSADLAAADLIDIAEVIHQIRSALAAAGDPARAIGQKAYMKSSIDFYGVPVPQARHIARQAGKKLTLPQIEKASRILWDEATHREERYAAVALTNLPRARGQLELVPLHEYEALTGAWWDFVDEIAHRIADTLDAHPNEVTPIVLGWSRHESFWLRRLAIESQLQRRERTDTALLAEVIEPNLADREFFIRKAIGWALRDYAYAAPEWVQEFVDTHDLSPLSRREATKHLGATCKSFRDRI